MEALVVKQEAALAVLVAVAAHLVGYLAQDLAMEFAPSAD